VNIRIKDSNAVEYWFNENNNKTPSAIFSAKKNLAIFGI
jgi:hypothetical protein